MKKQKFEIVLGLLIAGEHIEHTVTLPDGLTYGWYNNHLCHVLKVYTSGMDIEGEPSEYRWVEANEPFNYFVKQCSLLSEEEIANLVFQAVQIKG